MLSAVFRGAHAKWPAVAAATGRPRIPVRGMSDAGRRSANESAGEACGLRTRTAEVGNKSKSGSEYGHECGTKGGSDTKSGRRKDGREYNPDTEDDRTRI